MGGPNLYRAVMRGIAAALCLFALLPAGAQASPRKVMTAPLQVTLTGRGLVLRGTPLAFGTPRGRAIQLATAVLGPVTEDAVDAECGVGHPIASTSFRNGLELSFVRNRFVGWTMNYGGDHRILTANRVGLGMTVSTLKRLNPRVSIERGNDEGGGIGPGFDWGNGVHGWLEDITPNDKVIGLYAGETCIVE